MASKLCERCRLASNLDANNQTAMMKHHSSYHDIVKFARNGCELCVAIVSRFGEQLSGEIMEQEQSGLRNQADDMQIFYRVIQRKDTEDSYIHIVFESKIIESVPQFLPRRSATGGQIEGKFNPQVGRMIPRSCRSPACFEMVSQWMARCRKYHERCNRDLPSPSLMPTRVLDIGDMTNPPRIVVTHDMKGEYATLSYCWGKGCQQPVTTTSNLEHRQVALYLTTLPPVFQDAMIITRNLGYRYLWIDCLCILQDSAVDWNAESVKMHQYYMGSSLNIIAAAAEDPTCGIFDSADRFRNGCKYNVTQWRSYFNADKNFIAKRAWTLQEEILPPRSILYTCGAIYWLCNHESCTETCPVQPEIGGYCLHSMTKNKLLFNLPAPHERYQPASQGPMKGEIEENDKNQELIYWWYEIVEIYMTRELSFDRDRLPGIAGLAKEFARRTNVRYICGLWREDFIAGLCWSGNGTRIKTTEYLGPTWSWATIGTFDHRHKLWARLHIGKHLHKNEEAAKLVDIYIVNESEDPYARVKEAAILLEGSSRKMSSLPDPDYFEPFRGIREPWKEPRCRLDDESAIHANSPILEHPEAIYFQLGTWGYGNEPEDSDEKFALVLEPTGRKGVHFSEYIEYRRVGIATNFLPDELTQGWVKQKVAII